MFNCEMSYKFGFSVEVGFGAMHGAYDLRSQKNCRGVPAIMRWSVDFRKSGNKLEIGWLDSVIESARYLSELYFYNIPLPGRSHPMPLLSQKAELGLHL